MGIGVFYALVCAVCWSIAVVLFKYAGNSLSATALNLTKNVIGLCLLAPTALLIEGINFPELNGREWLILVVSGYCGVAVADTWYLQALRNLGAGRTAIVASLYSPFVGLLSLLFLGESMHVWQWFGFALVIIGIVVVTYQRHYESIEKLVLLKGLAFGASSVFVTAASVVAMKPLLVNDGFFWMIALRMSAGVLGMLLYLAFRTQLATVIDNIRFEQHKWVTITVASVFGTYLAIVFWLAGFKYADASVASVLNETSSAMIVLLAWLFLKEKISFTKVVGLLLTFLGVMFFIGSGS